MPIRALKFLKRNGNSKIIFEKMKNFKKQPLSPHSLFGTQLQDKPAFFLFVNKMPRSLFVRNIELSIGCFTGAYSTSAIYSRSLDEKEEPMIGACTYQNS